ncbi:MAG: ABC transporter permease [Actinomycetota bacterium]|nr:ABC transporter permease [Actinomycetota bacterium]
MAVTAPTTLELHPPAVAPDPRPRSRATPSPASGFWRLREEIPARLRRRLVVASLIVPFLAWTVISATGLVQPLFLPSPASVLRAGAELLSGGELVGDLLATLTRVAVGFAIVVAISVPLGLAIGSFAAVRSLFEPMIGLLRYLPAPAFIPLLIIWLGLGESSKIALLVIGTVFFNTLMSADVAALVPKELINAAYTMGASRSTVVRKVVLPHSVPGLLDAMRINLAATWNLVVVAELIAAQQGLGYRITRAQRFLQTDDIFALLVVIGVLGVAMDFGFRGLRRAVAPWAR